MTARLPSRHAPDSRFAWWRLATALGAMTLGSSTMYVVAVVLPFCTAAISARTRSGTVLSSGSLSSSRLPWPQTIIPVVNCLSSPVPD